MQNDNNNAAGSTFYGFRSPGSFLFFSTNRWQKGRHYDNGQHGMNVHYSCRDLLSVPDVPARGGPHKMHTTLEGRRSSPLLSVHPKPEHNYSSCTLLLALLFVLDSSSLSIFYFSPGLTFRPPSSSLSIFYSSPGLYLYPQLL